MKEIEDWFIVCTSSPYVAPELVAMYVCGICNGHNIRTSYIKKIDDSNGIIVNTRSGNSYKLIGNNVQEPEGIPNTFMVLEIEEVKKLLLLRNN